MIDFMPYLQKHNHNINYIVSIQTDLLSQKQQRNTPLDLHL